MKWRSLEESTQELAARFLSETYAARKELIAKYVPPDIQAVHARVVDELKQSGIADRALKSGDAVSEFELPDHNGNLIRSADLLSRGPLIICFFRGRWCPFCVGQMEAMNAILPRLQELSASLVAISPQTVHQSYLMADQHKLRFPLLSDAQNKVARQFGLIYRVPDYQQEIYSRVFVNLPFLNGDASWELPVPATYIVGRDSAAEARDFADGRPTPQSSNTILYASPDSDYTTRPEPMDILRFFAQLRR